MSAANAKNGIGQYYNIATGKKITLNKLLETLCEIYKIDCTVNYSEPRKGDIKASYAKIDKASTVLKWQPKVDLKQGLELLCKSL